MDRSAEYLLDTVHHRNDFQRKIYNASLQQVQVGSFPFELTKTSLSKTFDLDPKIIEVYRADQLDIMKSTYIWKYVIDNFDKPHSCVTTLDLNTQKITVTATNVQEVRGQVYYLTMGTRIKPPTSPTNNKTRRR